MTVCIDDRCLLSHCAECDAHPDACRHTSTRYLHPIIYEPVYGAGGERIGFRVPDDQRAEWDAREKLIGKWSEEIADTRTRLQAWDADHPHKDETRNTCLECGKQLEHGQRAYCSREHASRAWGRRLQDERLPL